MERKQYLAQVKFAYEPDKWQSVWGDPAGTHCSKYRIYHKTYEGAKAAIKEQIADGLKGARNETSGLVTFVIDQKIAEQRRVIDSRILCRTVTDWEVAHET